MPFLDDKVKAMQSAIVELQKLNFVAEYDEQIDRILAGTAYRGESPAIIGRVNPFSLTHSDGWFLHVSIRQLFYIRHVNTIEEAARIVLKIYADLTISIETITNIDDMLEQLQKEGFQTSLIEAKQPYIRVEAASYPYTRGSFNIFCVGEYFLLLNRKLGQGGSLIFGAETLQEVVNYLCSLNLNSVK